MVKVKTFATGSMWTDHVEALYFVLTSGSIGETYNIGGNNERQNIELVRFVCKLMDELCPSEQPYSDLITYVTDRPGHDMRYAINSAKIRDKLGWEPKEDFESGFRKTVIWYLENQNWTNRILSGTTNSSGSAPVISPTSALNATQTTDLLC